VLLVSLPVFKRRLIVTEEIIPVNIITPPAQTVRAPVKKKTPVKKKAPPAKKPAPPPKAPKIPQPEKLPELMPRVEPPPVPEISLKERIQKRLAVKEPPAAPRPEPKPPPVRERTPEPPPPPEASPVREALVLEAADFSHAWYIAVIKGKIFQSWTPPGRLVTARPGTGAHVKFRVERSGRISEITLEKSSGYTLLDRSALEAVSIVQDLPPLPADYQEESLYVVVFFQQLEG
jgi:TonB family protein